MFLHYCGGELENINYVVKGTTCCSGDEDSEPMDMGCCKDENLVLKNNPDFTLKQFNNYDLVKTFCALFYISLPISNEGIQIPFVHTIASIKVPPPKLQNTLVISTSVLRI